MSLKKKNARKPALNIKRSGFFFFFFFDTEQMLNPKKYKGASIKSNTWAIIDNKAIW